MFFNGFVVALKITTNLGPVITPAWSEAFAIVSVEDWFHKFQSRNVINVEEWIIERN